MSKQPIYKDGDAVLAYVGHSGGRGDEGWVQGVYRESPHPGHGVDLGGNRFIVINADGHIKRPPHADYPGGADQYREDVATLTEAGEWGFKPQDTGNNDYDVRVAEGDWNNIVNALDAAGRFVPYALARLGGAS